MVWRHILCVFLPGGHETLLCDLKTDQFAWIYVCKGSGEYSIGKAFFAQKVPFKLTLMKIEDGTNTLTGVVWQEAFLRQIWGGGRSRGAVEAFDIGYFFNLAKTQTRSESSFPEVSWATSGILQGEVGICLGIRARCQRIQIPKRTLHVLKGNGAWMMTKLIDFDMSAPLSQKLQMTSTNVHHATLHCGMTGKISLSCWVHPAWMPPMMPKIKWSRIDTVKEQLSEDTIYDASISYLEQILCPLSVMK